MKTQNVALEGLSFSGKTSAVRALGARIRALAVAELSDFHDGGLGFPTEKLGVQSTEEVDDWFVRAEEDRCEQARKSASKNQISTIIFDRCYLSIAIHAKVSAIMLSRKGPPEVFERIRRSINAKRLINPAILYLKVDMETHAHRSREYFQELSEKDQKSQFELLRIERHDQRRSELECVCYDALFSNRPDLVIDANRDLEDVHANVQERIKNIKVSPFDADRIMNELQRIS